jgi:hypothetical protein
MSKADLVLVKTEDRAVRALAEVRDELERIPRAELRVINLDIAVATTTALESMRRARRFRPIIAAGLKDFDLDAFDKIETYALAATPRRTPSSRARRPR